MDAAVSHIWQSTVFAAAAGVFTLMFRNNSAAVRYWIWFAAGIKFLVPFAALAAAANFLSLPSPPAARPAMDVATAIFVSPAIRAIPEPALNIVIICWLLGVLAVLAGWVLQWQRLAADVRQSPRSTSGLVHDTLRHRERAEGLRRATTLVTSRDAMEPGVLGIRNPVLIWPLHLSAGLSDTHVEAIVAHEVCHIVRRDNLLASMQLMVSAVFWFHPLVWWIGARLVDERERACDERVLACGLQRATYAESILKTCDLCIASPLVNVAGITGGHLKTRILRIMNNAPALPLGTAKKTVVAFATLVAFFIPIVGGVAAPPAIAAPAQDAGAEVHRPGGRITTPRVVKDVRPQYTRRAMDEKIEGEVLMECVVKTDGTVGDTKIVKSLDPDLDQAALDAAAQWLFEPGTRDGKPVNVLVAIAMTFTLK
jgi:bla regulator protein blaR1